MHFDERASQSGQYVTYTFFKARPEWRRLPVEEREAMKDAFADAVEEHAARFDTLNIYSTTGIRPDCDFFFWKIAQRYGDLGEFGAALNASPLAGVDGRDLQLPGDDQALHLHERPQGAEDHPEGLSVSRGLPVREGAPLVYFLPEEGPASDAMDEHIRVGAGFTTIHNHTTYLRSGSTIRSS